MSTECLIIVVIDYDMISCYYQDMKVILVYVVIRKRIRGNVLLPFYSTLKRRNTRCGIKLYIFIILHVRQFFSLIAKLINEKVDNRHREIVEREFIKPVRNLRSGSLYHRRHAIECRRWAFPCNVTSWKSKIQGVPIITIYRWHRLHRSTVVTACAAYTIECSLETAAVERRGDSSVAGSLRRRGE